MELSLKLLDEQALLEQDADLLTSIGYALETGTVFEQNYVLAAQIYSIAEQMIGGEKALNNLAWLMLNGFGIEQNIPRAIELFTKAAEAGDTTAMVNLGNIYEFPLSGEAPDYRRAIRWYKQAAECGNIKGLFNYANMYHHGYGVRKNRKKAYEIFDDLYQFGYPGTAFYMGLYHECGYVVKRDYQKAMEYYSRGAEEGSPYCLNQIATMYAKGRGVIKDYAAAFEYYKKAAALGDTLAMSNIGYCYEVGQGVEQDLGKARKWYEAAAKESESHATEALERLFSGGQHGKL